MSTPAPTRTAAPAVVAVVVTRDPGPWFETAVDALAAQDYSNLAILFIDAGSKVDVTPRFVDTLPDAFVRRLDEQTGYGAAANEVVDIVDGAAFYCFLHDDAAPEPHAISTLVNEAMQSNAGIVGSKLVRLDDHRRILQVGESIDKTGERSRRVEPGELDQEQHDAVEDVFVTPSGCLLVRSDLFSAIGGWDDGIDLLNDDLNLCWRAHVAGARVVVAPDAVVGHAEALGERSDILRRRERLIRHRLRTMLVCYSPWHLARVLPQAMVTAVLEVVYSVLVGRRGQARDVIAAWRWNWKRRGEIRDWRRRVHDFRGVSDAEVRRFQVRGSARVLAFARGQSARGGTRSNRLQARLTTFRDGLRSGRLRIPVLAWSITVLILAVGSRHLLTRGIAVVGGLPAFDLGPRDLLDSFLSGWRTAGLGAAAPSPTGLGLLSAYGALFLGNMGLARTVLLLGSIVVGAIGAYRLLRPTDSPTAQGLALVVYAAAPIGLDSIAAARWGSLLVYASAPWILGQLARAGDWAPFGALGGVPGSGDGADRTVGRAAALGLTLAVIGAIEPAVIIVTLALAAGLALGSVIAGVGAGAGRLILVSVLGAGAAVGLHVPWTLEFILPGATWDLVVGPARDGAAPSALDLLRFQIGPVGGGRMALGLPIAAALPLLIGREWRFEWAVRLWTAALVLLGLLWADGHGWLPLHGPTAETVLAPVAVCFAAAVGLGVVAFERDLRAYGFGWRQLVSAAAAVALVIGATPTLLDAGNGRWYAPDGGLETTFAFLDQEPPGFRVLWVGDPDVLPVPGQPLDLDGTSGVVFATTDDGLASITDAWPVAPGGPDALVRDAIQLAVDGETSRLGRLLAPMAIRFVVVPSASAPSPLGGVERPLPLAVVDTLDDQLDLAGVPVNPAYLVYRNEAAIPARASLTAPAGDGTTFAVSAADVADVSAVLAEQTGLTTWTGSVPAGSRILHSASASEGWELEVDGQKAGNVKLFGWAQGFEPLTGGDARLRYATSPLRYAVLAFQAIFWLVAIRLARTVRRPGTTPVVVGVPAVTGMVPADPDRASVDDVSMSVPNELLEPTPPEVVTPPAPTPAPTDGPAPDLDGPTPDIDGGSLDPVVGVDSDPAWAHTVDDEHDIDEHDLDEHDLDEHDIDEVADAAASPTDSFDSGVGDPELPGDEDEPEVER